MSKRQTFSSMIVIRVKITSSTAMSCKLVQLQGQRLLGSTIGLLTQQSEMVPRLLYWLKYLSCVVTTLSANILVFCGF